MKRSSFLKTLLGLSIAPKVLGEIENHKPDAPPVPESFAEQTFYVGDIINGNKGAYLVTATFYGNVTAKGMLHVETVNFQQNSKAYYKLRGHTFTPLNFNAKGSD